MNNKCISGPYWAVVVDGRANHFRIPVGKLVVLLRNAYDKINIAVFAGIIVSFRIARTHDKLKR
jgi:hypothetical protein